MKPELYLSHPEADFWADFSFVDFPDDYLSSMESNISSALQAMQQLESGAIANPDENRMVGHYWLRNADLAPSEELTNAIRETLAKVKEVANAVHSGSLSPHRVHLLICSSLVSAVLHWVHSLLAKHLGIRIPINYGYTSLTTPILTESIIPSLKSEIP